MISFYISGKLPTLNEYTKASRGNIYASAGLKKKTEDYIISHLKLAKWGEIKPPYTIHFVWYENTQRRDKDNVCFAKKFLLDALQKAKVIENDNNKYIKGFTDSFIYSDRQGVEVFIVGDDDE